MMTRRALVTKLSLLAALVVGPIVGLAEPVAALSPRHPDGLWVEAAYRATLGRPPTAAQSRHRTAQLAGGTSRRAVADELVGSAEHAGRVVDQAYRRVLGRSPSATDRSYWVGRLQGGEGVRTVTSFLYGSPEVFARAGSTNEAWVRFLYADVLGRPAPDGDVAYWVTRLDGGEVRTAVARAWLGTAEATGLQVQVLFRAVLGRPPTGAEVTDWSARLRRDDVRAVTAALVTTAAFDARARSGDTSVVIAVGNGNSFEPSLSADGRIVAFGSGASNLTARPSPPGDDVFVYDRVTGRLRAVTAGNGNSHNPKVSADGSTVVFWSYASDLVPGDTNGQADIFRAPTSGAGPVERLTDGADTNFVPQVSGDGSVVVFASEDGGLVPDDPGTGEASIFLVEGDGPVRRLGPSGRSASLDVSADGSTVLWSAPDGMQMLRLDDDGAAPVPLQRATGPLTDKATVSADGATVAWLESGAGSQVVFATLADDGTVSAEQAVTVGAAAVIAELVDDGTAAVLAIASGAAAEGSSALLRRAGSPPSRLPGIQPTASGDGDLVVSAVKPSGQSRRIVLFALG